MVYGYRCASGGAGHYNKRKGEKKVAVAAMANVSPVLKKMTGVAMPVRRKNHNHLGTATRGTNKQVSYTRLFVGVVLNIIK